ncbi:MAG TPA: 3-hydroxyacyl-CoA dehydrogenase family protein [Cyclobacteriaceae bacterium]|nr:3-hydroxyacyl-CoA dehydrogenase family protein [Cyclobacteriaceae bacterium]
MEILIVGNAAQLEEIRKKFGTKDRYRLEPKRIARPAEIEMVFDFLNDGGSDVSIYNNYGCVVFLNSVLTTLNKLKVDGFRGSIFGFCGLPTFVDRPVFEVTLAKEDNNEFLLSTCARLGTEYCVVADKVGMVTPRVICMIINEAYYTEEEGTATREDIDKAMKLGTNYPYGPFEWCERIGRQNVCELLNAVLVDTGDDRYTISRKLLSTE